MSDAAKTTDSAKNQGDTPPHRYNAALAQEIEGRWQQLWAEQRTYYTPNPGEPGFDASKAKKYILDMFPYPSGVGLHVGHPLGYIATDIYARYLRMAGYNVLHTMGFDAFGLPAEQFAIQTGTHPRVSTERNIATMRQQLTRLGLGHDPHRSVSTTDTDFYKWTQWIFKQIYESWYDEKAGKARPIAELVRAFESGAVATSSGRAWKELSEGERRAEVDGRRLAFLSDVPVNWCPMLGTVLANEEVTAEGRSERGNFPVYKRPLRQWMMRITAYADRLLSDLEKVDWPEPIKLMQRNWIGKSEGAHVEFELEDVAEKVTVFTTRPDTLFGATYMVLSPEHPLVDRIAPAQWLKPGATTIVQKEWRGVFPGAPAGGYGTPSEAIAAYRAYAKGKTDEQRTEAKEKTGVFTGAYAINPATGTPIPVFIADYVLMGYGTGAIMAVPAHDERDFEFAQALNLPIRDVVYPPDVLALRHFAQHAYQNSAAPAYWREQLADFMGLVITSEQKYPYEEALLIVRKRRGEPTDSAKQSGRGKVQGQWLKTLEKIDVRSADELKSVFASAAYYRKLGHAFTEHGTAVNSSGTYFSITGLPTPEAKASITKSLEERGAGRRAVTYKLRDWLFSRQRYWGEPFPVVYDEAGVAHALPDSMLPLLLPELEDFRPETSDDPDAPVRTPLNRAREWVSVTLDLGDGPKRYTRETNTMPNWAGSCWYYLRYLDPANPRAFVDKHVDQYWMGSSGATGGVDLYVGGVEHAVLHLLYARFWHKVLFDLGHVSTPEPFQKLFNQGYIQEFAFKDPREIYVDAFKVTDAQGRNFMEFKTELKDSPGPWLYDGEQVIREYGKMGKSLKNAVSPDEMFTEFGCDTLRVYEMAMGPLEASKPWNTRDIIGSYRFLQKVWRNLIDEGTGVSRCAEVEADRASLRLLHKTIIGVRRDMESLGFNTVVSKLIELNNHLGSLPAVPVSVAAPLILMLAPLAPHLAEELWHRVMRLPRDPKAERRSIVYERFPIADEKLAADDEIEIPVSVMGKLRSKITVPAGSDGAAIEAAAKADPRVQELIAGKAIKKVIVVPGKMVNFVVG
ncbi:MAG TPA: class I tRNA ligase family protein [Phycisphaerales bacterium]|nr:class I tRNA ligase family protein [Phycisphaerales bacterium]